LKTTKKKLDWRKKRNNELWKKEKEWTWKQLVFLFTQLVFILLYLFGTEEKHEMGSMDCLHDKKGSHS